jgi:hypothetical protein
MTTNEPQRLTYEQAVAMLPDNGRIHTFVNPAGILVGTDWDREQILDLLRTGEPELAGDMATSMGHGLAAHRGTGPVFIETKSGAS